MSETLGVLRKIPLSVISFVIGAGLGVAIEANTDAIASKKVITAETCLELHPLETKITKDFVECTKEGVPGGTEIGSDKFDVGEPAPFVDAYIKAQEAEQGLEPDRIFLWGMLGAVVGLADFVID